MCLFVCLFNVRFLLLLSQYNCKFIMCAILILNSIEASQLYKLIILVGPSTPHNVISFSTIILYTLGKCGERVNSLKMWTLPNPNTD